LLGFLKYIKGSPTISGDLTVDGTLTSVQLVAGTITDPGDAGAIPVTASGSCAITTAGAETRTIAAPTFAGQLLNLSLDVDGGNCTITVATTFNQNADNTLIGADAGDQIMLVAGDVAGTPLWKIVCNDGWAVSTV